MEKKQISTKLIVIIIAILIVIVAIFAIVNANTDRGDVSGYVFTISEKGETVASYSLAQIKEMPSVTVETSIESTSYADESGAYTGVPLEYLLDLADSGIMERCTKFITLAGDAYSSALSIEDVEIAENVLVIYEKDGVMLTPFRDGGAGPMRIIIASDTYGNRCTKFLVGVECR